MRFILLVTLAMYSFFSNAVTISNNATENNLSAQTGGILRYELVVPAGANDLNININGNSGDADLYIRHDSRPTTSTYDCRPYRTGSNESCEFSSPSIGTYFIDVCAYSSFSNINLTANYQSNSTPTTPDSTELINGNTVNNLQGAQNSEREFFITVPDNTSNFVISSNGGSGDLDLHVKFGSAATQSNYDCRPYRNGNNEICSFSSTQVGTYHIMLHGYSAYNNVGLTTEFQTSDGFSNNDSNNNGSNNYGSTWDGFNGYYANAIGKSGIALVNALHEADARNHNRMSYSQVWDALQYTDEDPNNSNNVILMYTGRSQSKTFTASGNSDPDAWNREHSWPKSHGFPSSGDWAYTDIHHLRPSDVSVNSRRGNKDYDNGGSSISEAPGNYTDSNSFEPRDDVKGDIARMMFYMDTRYNDSDSTGTDDLVLVDHSNTSGSELGDLCTLLEWHKQDPVSEREVDRHARIVERQGNRNPFVDYPNWVDQIWDPACQ